MFNGLLGCRAVVRPLAIRRCVPSRPHAQSWRLPLIGTKRALSSKSAGTGTLFSLDDLPVSKLDGNGGTVGPLGSPPPPRSKSKHCIEAMLITQKLQDLTTMSLVDNSAARTPRSALGELQLLPAEFPTHHCLMKYGPTRDAFQVVSY